MSGEGDSLPGETEDEVSPNISGDSYLTAITRDSVTSDSKLLADASFFSCVSTDTPGANEAIVCSTPESVPTGDAQFLTSVVEPDSNDDVTDEAMPSNKFSAVDEAVIMLDDKKHSDDGISIIRSEDISSNSRESSSNQDNTSSTTSKFESDLKSDNLDEDSAVVSPRTRRSHSGEAVSVRSSTSSILVLGTSAQSRDIMFGEQEYPFPESGDDVLTSYIAANDPGDDNRTRGVTRSNREETPRNLYPEVVVKSSLLHIDFEEIDALKFVEPEEYSSSASSSPLVPPPLPEHDTNPSVNQSAGRKLPEDSLQVSHDSLRTLTSNVVNDRPEDQPRSIRFAFIATKLLNYIS